jgi:hypothetical protein
MRGRGNSYPLMVASAVQQAYGGQSEACPPLFVLTVACGLRGHGAFRKLAHEAKHRPTDEHRFGRLSPPARSVPPPLRARQSSGPRISHRHAQHARGRAARKVMAPK